MIYFLSLEEVLKLHDRQIEKFGGSVGIRDLGLLESALEAPQKGFGEDYFHAFPFEMAAAYLYHLSKNHPFVDGNKRTATDCMLTFLGLNGYQHTFAWQDLERIVLDTATGKLDKKAIAIALEKNSKKIDD